MTTPQSRMFAGTRVTEMELLTPRQGGQDVTLLLLEMSHRWCNGLQAISSSLHLSLRDCRGPASLGRRLSSIDGQLQALAALHRRLSAPPADVTLAGYCRALCLDVLLAYGRTEITPKLEICAACLTGGQAVRLGLIIAELMTNVVKHGRPQGRNATMWICLSPLGPDVLQLTSSDTFDIPNQAGFAPRLLTELVKDLGGDLSITTGGGYSTRIRFPALPPPHLNR